MIDWRSGGGRTAGWLINRPPLSTPILVVYGLFSSSCLGHWERAVQMRLWCFGRRWKGRECLRMYVACGGSHSPAPLLEQAPLLPGCPLLHAQPPEAALPRHLGKVDVFSFVFSAVIFLPSELGGKSCHVLQCLCRSWAPVWGE